MTSYCLTEPVLEVLVQVGIIEKHLKLLLKHLAAPLLITQRVQGSHLIQLHGSIHIVSELHLVIFISCPLLLR